MSCLMFNFIESKIILIPRSLFVCRFWAEENLSTLIIHQQREKCISLKMNSNEKERMEWTDASNYWTITSLKQCASPKQILNIGPTHLATVRGGQVDIDILLYYVVLILRKFFRSFSNSWDWRWLQFLIKDRFLSEGKNPIFRILYHTSGCLLE